MAEEPEPMSALHVAQYQQAMAEELLAAVPPASGWLHDRLRSDSFIAASGTKLRVQLAVYRNNVMHSLTRAMAAQFPVVCKVVGEAFFQALARDYVLVSPPRQPMLTFYGDTFPAFIRNHEYCGKLPYLHDLAKLEWLCQKALHAADDDVLHPTAMTGLDPGRLPGGIFQLKDSVSLLSSPYPVCRIWEENLGDDPQTVDLSRDGPAFVMVYRHQYQVQVISLQEPVFALLYRLKQGACIGDAWSSVSAQHQLDDDQLPAILAWLFGLNIFRAVEFS